MGIDDLLEQMRQDELDDGIELAREGKVAFTPIEYAKARGILPQRVYGAFRSGKLTWSTCQCGRRIVDVVEADEYFKFDKQPGDLYGEEAQDE